MNRSLRTQSNFPMNVEASRALKRAREEDDEDCVPGAGGAAGDGAGAGAGAVAGPAAVPEKRPYLLLTYLASFGPAAEGEEPKHGFVEVHEDFEKWMVISKFKVTLDEEALRVLKALHKFLLELCLHGMGQRYFSRQIRCVFPTMGTLHFSSEDFTTTCFNPAFAARGTGVMLGALDNLNLAAQGLKSAVKGTDRGMDLIYHFHDHAESTLDVLRSAVDGGGKKQPVLAMAITGHSEHLCFKGRQYVVPTSVLSLSYGEY